MKTWITVLLTLSLALFVLIAFPTSGEESVYSDTLRLHVLAASDKTADQEAKLLVRDAVLAEYGDAFLALKSKEAAEAYLKENLPDIRETVERTLSEKGLVYAVDVTLTEEWFETRAYEEVTLPRGRYTALKITLDEGRGQNFWCMLYPALCVTPALGEETTAEAVYDDAVYELVTNGYAVRFRTLELISSLFR